MDLDFWLQVSEATEGAEERDEVEKGPESHDVELRDIVDKLERHLEFDLRQKICRTYTYIFRK